ncbi:ATP synthase subunit s, mitochondrial [Schistocerca serialis cubense]|uniref:ATP synthase subunit s, mitochondrial n=1 Tax=Schistocerca serialis cubense TaxID=2023355 RepID=UPI00214E24F6|nr:ATP synthase subunit s, mitochondrial [Schistocerca serialis cubense]
MLFLNSSSALGRLCCTMVPSGSHLVGASAKRTFYHWLNKIWNNVDTERIKAVGPDRACAEWLMKNGASIKWASEKDYVTDYNKLAAAGEKQYIEEIDASHSSIMGYGFPYFEGCNHIKFIRLHKCHNIDDDALASLAILKHSLKHLEVSSCGNVTDKGITSLVALENLNTLILFNLPGVKDKEKTVNFLKAGLKSCMIDYK